MTNFGPEHQALVPLTPTGAHSVAYVPAGSAAAGGSADPAGAKITPMGLFAAFRRKLWPAIGLGLLLAAPVAVAVWFLLPPPKPRVSATMYMTGTSRGNLFEHPDAVIDRQTQMALIRSKLVLAAALRDPEVSTTATVREQVEPLDWLGQTLGIDYPYGPEIIRLSLVVTGDVEDAKKIVNAVRKSYLDEIVNKSASDRKARQDQLQTIQTQAHESLRRKQASVRKLAEAAGGGSTEPKVVALQQQLVQEQFSMAQRELVKLQSDLRRMGLELVAVKAAASYPVAPPTDKAVEQYVDGDPAFREYSTRKAKFAAEMKDIERIAVNPATNTQYQKLTADTAALDKDIADARKKARDDYMAAAAVQAQAGVKTRLAVLNEQIAYQKELEALLEKELERLARSIKTINTVNLDLEAERIDIKQAEDLYAKVTAAISTLQAEENAPVRVRPLENASVEPVNLDGRKAQYAGAAFVGVFALMCLLVALWEFFQGRVESPDAISRACGLTVIGTIPRVPARMDRGKESSRLHWQSLLTESMACTQTMIRYGVRESLQPQIILITSAGTSEGKTSLASQLAVSFARGGVKTLLIDGDLRQPAAHECFDMPAGPGLGEVLRGDQPASELVRPVRPNLDFLPAGRCDDAALTALANGVGPADLRQFKSLYEVVIIDSSPMLPVADTSHYARQADGVLVTVLAGHSRTAMVREATRRLRHLGAPLLGLVVNGVSHGSYGYGYGYGYGTRVHQTPVQAS